MADTILIVDDDPKALALVCGLLEKRGFDVLTAESGSAALECVYTRRVDLLILDVLMPEMSGIEVCETLRADPLTRNLPIVLLSARSEVQVKVAGLKAGADEYLTKPISPTELEARVRGLLDRTRRLLGDGAGKSPIAGGGALCCFVGATGGVGTTTVVLNAAAALARQERSVIAAELVPFFGGFASHLGQEPLKNLANLAHLAPGSLVGEPVSEVLYRFPGGMQVLFGPQTAAESESIRGWEHAKALAGAMQSLSEVAVLDVGSVPSTALKAIAQRSRLIGLVLEPAPTSIEAGRRWLDLFNLWGISSALVGAVVVNRSPSVAIITATEVGRVLGCRILGVVPEARQLCEAAHEAGQPLVEYQPANVVSASLATLATKVTELLGLPPHKGGASPMRNQSEVGDQDGQ